MNQEINGWKIVSGYEVFVKNGKIMRGVIENHNGSEITAYPYRLMPDGSWSREIGVTLAALRAAARRGTMEMK